MLMKVGLFDMGIISGCLIVGSMKFVFAVICRRCFIEIFLIT